MERSVPANEFAGYEFTKSPFGGCNPVREGGLRAIRSRDFSRREGGCVRHMDAPPLDKTYDGILAQLVTMITAPGQWRV